MKSQNFTCYNHKVDLVKAYVLPYGQPYDQPGLNIDVAKMIHMFNVAM